MMNSAANCENNAAAAASICSPPKRVALADCNPRVGGGSPLVQQQQQQHQHQQQQPQQPLLFKRLSDRARPPTRGSPGAVGYDLCAAADAVVPAAGKAVVPTDLALALPPGCYGRVAPRSGLAVKSFIDVGAGVIDADYRGNVGVVLFNHNAASDFAVRAGDRIAQLILEVAVTPPAVEADELDATERGAGGYGSTGV